MPHDTSLGLGLAFAAAAMWPGAGTAATYQIIANRPGGITAALAADPHGKLYGVDANQYGDSNGELFVLTPPAGGSATWGNATLLAYIDAYPEIYVPNGVALSRSGIVQTSQYGLLPGGFSGGTAALITPTGAIKNLHAFLGGSVSPPDGQNPQAPLAAGPNGLYYGTTSLNEAGLETVFQVSASPASPDYAILHVFGSIANDGDEPSPAALTAGPNTMLYGVTMDGGTHRLGTAYALQYSNGSWSYRVLHSFGATGDLQNPPDNMVLDAQGNLYGCAGGGPTSYGGIFRLTPGAHPTSNWTESVVYTFGAGSGSGFNPANGCGLAIDTATGRLVGEVGAGGVYGYGVLFEVDPPAAGQIAWTETVLHSFDGSMTDGGYPEGAPIKVGATYYGGTSLGSRAAAVLGSIYAMTP
jgi:hypothetical protein